MTDIPSPPTPCHPFGEAFTALTEVISDLGFDGVLYSFYPKPMYMSKEVQPVLHYSESFTPFVAHYIENNYGNHDFVLRLALQDWKRAIDWWEEIYAGHVTHEERAVTEDARKNFGIQYGLSVPALRSTFAIAGISVISKNDSLSHFQNLKKSHLAQLFTLASEYHATVINSKESVRFFIQPLLESLNATQKAVLKHILTGKPMKSIPDTCGITPKYAENVLANIRQEFGKITTNELIYILGMANMHEYL
ncbi:MAG: autoinducer binding domain-containing protein [Thiothrix sp.]|uniref:autoinducer binding domain-containing protein n=1 Tax=Thiothrix sp. TaxID=1032 RepID=UPI00263855F0|nr:autoinducer binding domain-containing protein [Thiothrix sp.]MDD5395079.1 autoinducer binding domain-containing protein [Thiothrix sp.]